MLYVCRFRKLSFNISRKNTRFEGEIDKLNKNISEAAVTSEIDGVVKTINSGSSSPDMYSTDTSFMTILATGDFRVKGQINEMNMGSIMEGVPCDRAFTC